MVIPMAERICVKSRGVKIEPPSESEVSGMEAWVMVSRIGGADTLVCHFGGADILVCYRIREWRDILVPPERIRVCSGGKNATTRRLAADKNVCPTMVTRSRQLMTTLNSIATLS